MRLLTVSLVTVAACLLAAGSASAAVSPNLKAPICVHGVHACIPVDRDDVDYVVNKVCDAVCVLNVAAP